MAEVRVQNLNKSFGELKAVNNVSFHAKSGEFLFLLGPSGCGKTTSLRTIAGLEEQDSGKVLVGGKDVSDTPVHKRNLGFVFQNYALFPHMTVRQNIEFGLRMKKINKRYYREKVSEILSLVGLEGYEDRKPDQLSGGEKQRIALCRTLVLDPQVLLLDEPLSNLDAKLRKRMRVELENIQNKLGLTTIHVTHDQEEALAMADRIILMNNGSIVQEGTPPEIYEKPLNGFVADFMGQVNCYRGKVVKVTDNKVALESEKLPRINVLQSDGKKLKEGKDVFFMVKKEGIKINSSLNSSKEINSVEGEVLVASYYGSHIEFICGFPGKSGQIILKAPVDISPVPTRGEKVNLQWDYDNAFIIECFA